ncbi:hypothetical protein REPUB_Repub02eG0227400 [Reevesia pubescens]
MKAKFVEFITFMLFAFLLCSYSTSARLLPQQQGEKEFKAKEILPAAGFLAEEDFSNLMGSEECYEKDEDCVKRRMIAEAHLDYIYTQHQKP